MILEYIKTFHVQDIINIMSDQDILGYYSIKIDFIKLFETYPDIGDKVLCSPAISLPSCNKDIIKLQQEILEKDEYKSLITKLPFTYLKRNVSVRFLGLPVSPELHRTIFPRNADLGCFLTVTGTVVRVTQAKMLEYQRKYVCMKCKFENSVEANFEQRYILKAPNKCLNTEVRCRSSTFTQVNLVSREHCKDYQEIKIQELLNKLSIGTIPGSMWVVLENDLVDCCKPGDDVIICGIVRRRWRPSANNKRSEVELVLQANYIEVINEQRSEVIAMAPDIKECFDEFWRKYQPCPLKGRDKILSSVCPQVYGLYLVKLAILLTVVTGSNHMLQKSQRNSVSDEKDTTHIRGQCHLLLVGDPGTGKSQLLRASVELTPRSVFTTGAGSTRAGLTCAALREDGEWQLEAGALVLSDGGVCCIDEISHLREHDRTAIHEAMEQQTISVAKAGIVCTLNTRCAVIAACNPKGRYEKDQPLSVNVSLGTPLLSRFDLIFILLDSKNKSWDKLVSSYILWGDNNTEANVKWTIEKLQMYIGLVGSRYTKMTKSANTILQYYYMMQRKSEYRDTSRTTVRMLDSLIRLSQAHSRLMYRTTILPMDAIMAISLVDLSMQDCALQDTLDALHSTFQKYPDFDYLCTAKKLLTRMNLYEIWREELLYYAKLLQVDHKTLESDIENGNSQAFTKYDNIVDENIPLSACLVTSSYFNKNHSSDKKIGKTAQGDEGKFKNKIINEKLAATLKKHATLNKIQKEPPVVMKKRIIKRKRKEVTINTNLIVNKKQKVRNKKIKKVENDNFSESVCDENELLNGVPSVNDVFTELGINLKFNSDTDSDSGANVKNKDISNKTVVNQPVLDKKIINNDFNSSNKKNDGKSFNKTINKLKQFKCKTKHDLNKFYDEKDSSLKIDKTIKSLNRDEKSLSNSSRTSQISMFESNCDIDLDI